MWPIGFTFGFVNGGVRCLRQSLRSECLLDVLAGNSRHGLLLGESSSRPIKDLKTPGGRLKPTSVKFNRPAAV